MKPLLARTSHDAKLTAEQYQVYTPASKWLLQLLATHALYKYTCIV